MIGGLACGLIALSGLVGQEAKVQSAPRSTQAIVLPLASSISNTSVSPGTVSFTLSDPDAAAVSGTGSVSWRVSGGATASTWNVGVSAAAGSFTGCTEVPVTAATARCTSITGGTGGTCSGSTVTLGSLPVQVASGNESTAVTNYTVNMSFAITDAWKYKGHTSPCTLSVTYMITAN